MADKAITDLTAAVVGDHAATTSALETAINITTTPASRKTTFGVLRDWLASAATGLAAVAVTVLSLTVGGVNASGADTAAGNGIVAAPISTGNALPGSLVFQVGQQVAGSSSTLQTLGTILTLSNTTAGGNSVALSSTLDVASRMGVGDTALNLTANHQNVILAIGGALTNVVGNATYGQVTIPTLTGSVGSSIFGQMIRPYFVRAASGAMPMMANLFLAQPLSPSTGAETCQDTAMLYIDAPMNEPVIGTNYAIKVDAGPCSFAGGIAVGTSATINSGLTLGGNITSISGGPNTFAGEITVYNSAILKLQLGNTDWDTLTHVGSEVQFYTGAGNGNTTFNIQALAAGGNLAGQLNLNPSGGLVTFGDALSTAAPSGGTAGAWKFGVEVTAVTTLDTAHYLQVDIGGTPYKVCIGT